jgi:hypothetical protein
LANTIDLVVHFQVFQQPNSQALSAAFAVTAKTCAALEATGGAKQGIGRPILLSSQNCLSATAKSTTRTA